MASGSDWNTLLKNLMPHYKSPHQYVEMMSTLSGEIWQRGAIEDENYRWKFGESNDSYFEAQKDGFSRTCMETRSLVRTPAKAKTVEWDTVNYLFLDSKACHGRYAFVPMSNSDVLPENLRTQRFKDLVKQRKLVYSTMSGGELASGVRFQSIGFSNIVVKKSEASFDFKNANDIFVCLEDARNEVLLIGAWDRVTAFVTS